MACALLARLSAILLPATACANAVSLQLAWDRNPESHVVGYRLYCGTQPGAYTRTQDVGNQTTTTLDGLTAASTYYFTVVAIADDGSLSEPSAEVSHRTPSAFSIWMRQYGATGEGNADADADGVANAVEYLTGGDPTRADDARSGGLGCTVEPTVPGQLPTLLFRYRRATLAASDPRLSHTLELSEDGLRQWAPASAMVGSTETTRSDPDQTGIERVEVRVPLDARQRSVFGRLRVTLDAP